MGVPKDYTGVCPYTNEYRTINVNYIKVPSIGVQNPPYIKKGFSCDLIEDCGLSKNCSVYNESPEES